MADAASQESAVADSDKCVHETLAYFEGPAGDQSARPMAGPGTC